MKPRPRQAVLVAAFSLSFLLAAVARPEPALPAALAGMATSGAAIDAALAPGVEYHRRDFSDPFGDGPLSVHYLVIDWGETAEGFTLALANCGGRRKRTSAMARERRALAAVNGGYHRTKDPSMPCSPVKIDGAVLESASPGGMALALAFDRGEAPVIAPFSAEILAAYDNVISGDDATAGRGLAPGATREARQRSRAPRTFVGVNVTNRVTVFAVADGRSRESTGAGFAEECALVMPFGCERVMNLDGGGSSTMVIRDAAGKAAVANTPSDGVERRICDALLLLDGETPASRKSAGNDGR